MTHSNMLIRNPWLLVFNNDHRTAYPPSITCDVHCSMMMIDVDAHELAESTCPAEASEGVDKTIRKAREADDGSVDVYNE